MNELQVTGIQKIGEHEFTGIEGGFGQGKKAMLVKDIAGIHGQPLFKINERINNNRKRFKDGIDIEDLKTYPFEGYVSEMGFTKASYGNSNNIYVLSERGYAKLLKILEDDKAWEIYDELVDGYFNMRKNLKQLPVDDLKKKRLEIMEDNKKTRAAGMLYKIALETSSQSAKEQILADAVEMITSHRTIPVMKQKEYSAGEVADIIGEGLTGNMVGRIAKILELKAEKPGQNEYGRWSNSKSQYSSKEVSQWLYFEKGVEAIKQELQRK
ncbi:ORF6N domain-containing protein [Lactococcus garvieae]|uniref:ORF6N domain-containing protein n=1 Tax=Lactococcus garvieae TaxID=1363 RepID=UPI001F61F111|nr:ORF6N domain-containing protein [Lactococcus garvieae]MCI3861092.1 ORF6N domain-containing protein [Lactococcus garvieae]